MAMTLSSKIKDSLTRPTFVLMHFLGGSGREWDAVVALLGDAYPTLRIDLPGFGDSAKIPGYTVEAMAGAVHETIAAAGLQRYILVGHSMSGKVAMVLARRAQNIQDTRLAGLVLIATSPPGPEPIAPEKRSHMLGSLGQRHPDDPIRAQSYISQNSAQDIPPAVEASSANEVLRMNRSAWTAWLTKGSNEDWAERVGVLDLPTLLIAGNDDKSLGPDAQRKLTLPHLRHGDLRILPNCSHLIPIEAPEATAALLREFVASLTPSVPASYMAFIASERLSPRTREVLEARLNPPTPPPNLLTPSQLETLAALLARILPGTGLNLTPVVLESLAKGDGWRYAVLPPDIQAYREHLDHLAAQSFAHLQPPAQDALLQSLAAQKDTAPARWFEDLRSAAVEAYMAHPATLARLGYSGIGVGGANTRYHGYVSLGPNQRESWEPLPAQPGPATEGPQ